MGDMFTKQCIVSKKNFDNNKKTNVMENSDNANVTMLGRQSTADAVPDLGDLLISGSVIYIHDLFLRGHPSSGWVRYYFLSLSSGSGIPCSGSLRLHVYGAFSLRALGTTTVAVQWHSDLLCPFFVQPDLNPNVFPSLLWKTICSGGWRGLVWIWPRHPWYSVVIESMIRFVIITVVFLHLFFIKPTPLLLDFIVSP